ncbi:TLC domain-containing protein 2-like [Hypomesus transpacificus]|uniref:TLC domain-containing protein 2-like n=1 Tax=Hypomesus transpacificus TaxID=137520 RepID=UPI001F076062|nr:TLC domain-containing protein 2-like [Hypomesus transpacificus]
MEVKTALLTAGVSACSFRLLNTLVKHLPVPEPARRKVWIWRNTFTSLVHSSLTGTWAVLCFYQNPRMAEDLISSHSLFSHALISVSTGYFVYDLLDMALNQRLSRSWEMLLHHYMVISCFSLPLLTRLYVGFAVVSLLVEVNSVFLHTRQLLRLARPRDAAGSPPVAYRVTVLLNLGTFAVFRVCTLGWMTRWFSRQRGGLPGFTLMLGSLGLGLSTILNTLLLYRLLRSDLLSNTRKADRDQ